MLEDDRAVAGPAARVERSFKKPEIPLTRSWLRLAHSIARVVSQTVRSEIPSFWRIYNYTHTTVKIEAGHSKPN